ncbi:MAG: hypothetical protein ACLTMP_01310 [Eggerthella lenta]
MDRGHVGAGARYRRQDRRQSAFLDVSDRQQKRYEQDIHRYSMVLCSVYDEIVEFDGENKTYRSLYSSAGRSPTEPCPWKRRSSSGPTICPSRTIACAYVPR